MQEIDNKDYSGWELEHFDNSKNFRKYQYELMGEYIKEYTAEVGPGNGENLKLYQNKCTKIDLFEPSHHLFERLKKKYKDDGKITILNEEFTTQKDKYNTIIYSDVLEHIERDDLEIKNALSSLKEDGYLIVNVPAFQHLYSQFDLDVNHYRRYNVKRFLKLTRDLEFKELNSIYFDSLGYVLSLLSRIFLSDYKVKIFKKNKNMGLLNFYF